VHGNHANKTVRTRTGTGHACTVPRQRPPRCSANGQSTHLLPIMLHALSALVHVHNHTRARTCAGMRAHARTRMQDAYGAPAKPLPSKSRGGADICGICQDG
jgi:hypothetical protein